MLALFTSSVILDKLKSDTYWFTCSPTSLLSDLLYFCQLYFFLTPKKKKIHTHTYIVYVIPLP